MRAPRTDRYDAFLSYSHTTDQALAPILQSGLERYAKPWYRPRVRRVFRDDANLAAEPGLWAAIERALEVSSWFVLLASPEAADSPWVDREVDWWLTHRSRDRLLIALTEGELADALPPALRRAESPEARWVDLRGVRPDGEVNPQDPLLDKAVVDLTATISGIPKDEIAGENARQRRRTRQVVGATITLLSVLLVVSLIVSLAFAVTNTRLTTALNTANARSLGQDSQARLTTDPDTATQLALAAFRADSAQLDARNALGQVFLARRSTTATHETPDSAAVSALLPDPSADVTVLQTPAGPLIADGLTGQAPTFSGVPGAGPDSAVSVTGGGRWVVVGDTGRPYRVLERATGVMRTLPEGLRAIGTATPDGAHLITGTPTSAGTQIRVDDLATGSSKLLVRLPEPTIAGLWQTSDPGRILVRAAGGAPGSGQLTLRDARTGAILSILPPGSRVGSNGSLVAVCATDLTLQVSDAASGASLRRVGSITASQPCAGYPHFTADGRHMVWTGSTAKSTSTVNLIEVADLTDGRRMSAWVPAAVGLDPTQPQSPRRDDVTERGISPSALSSLSVSGNRALAVDRGRIDTLALSYAPGWRNRKDETGTFPFTVGDGSTAVVSYSDGSGDAVRTADGAVLGALSPSDVGLLPGEKIIDRGGDPDRQTYFLTTSSPQGERLRDFALPSFRPLGVFDLVAAGAAGFASNGAHFGIVATAGGNVVVLADGTLSWWSAATHRLISPPVRLADNAADAAELDAANTPGIAISEAGDLVGVQEPAYTRPDGGAEPASVMLWRLGSDQPRRITADLSTSGHAIAISRGRLITLERPGTLVQRDVVTGAVLVPPIAVSPPTSAGRGILGIDVTGLLVTDESTNFESTAGFWNLDADQPVGTLTLPTGLGPGLLVNDRLDIDEDFDDFASVPIDPERWRSQLCRAQDRSFTDAERAVLPPGVDTGPPCS